MKPLYIFDLDGTLSLANHRQHVLDDTQDPHRWRRFYALCDRDQPNPPVIRTMELLRHQGADILIFSGRSDEVRDKTITWLAEHTSFMSWELPNALTMRAFGDHTPDDVLKKAWYDAMLWEDKNRLVAAFDDRTRIVKMWRANGVPCFQVADGDF